ncbi:hypothetical protein H4R18_003817 [Coemansia javaensis]|uniref:Uncharacterized protein n=1 Tax=Coemansia javaensis TaxID=2761396 RepID=A0A9W8H7Z5_9FUNG|nr:hypothetical protein H4R18_003817 [Coemansia javaensis]
MLRTTAVRKTAAAAARRLGARRLASTGGDKDHHHHHHDAEPKFEEENFGAPIWKYALGAVGALYLMGKYNDHVEASGQVHPLTKFYASIMTDKEENRRVFSEYQRDVALEAEYTMLMSEEHRDTSQAFDDAVYYKRTSPWGRAVGTDVDMSNARRRMPVKD